MSPRRLLGWSPRTYTDYEYDGDHLVRSITHTEPEFSRADLAQMLAYQAVGDNTGQYGELLSEAMSPDSDPARRDAPIQWVVEGPVVNHAEQVLETAKERFYERYPDSPRHGHKWSVRKADQSS